MHTYSYGCRPTYVAYLYRWVCIDLQITTLTLKSPLCTSYVSHSSACSSFGASNRFFFLCCIYIRAMETHVSRRRFLAFQHQHHHHHQHQHQQQQHFFIDVIIVAVITVTEISLSPLFPFSLFPFTLRPPFLFRFTSPLSGSNHTHAFSLSFSY